MSPDGPALGPWPELLAPHRPEYVTGHPPTWCLATAGGGTCIATLALDGAGFALAFEAPLPDACAGLGVLPRRLAVSLAEAYTTGDAALDRAAYIHLEHPGLRACLDAPTRAALVRLVARGGLVTGGAARLVPAATRGLTRDDAAHALAALVDVVDALGALTPDTLDARLLDIAEQDPDPAVRGRLGDVRHSAFARTLHARRLIASAPTEETFDALLATARDGTLDAATRSGALARLFADHPLPRLAAAGTERLWNLGLPDAELAAAVRRAGSDAAALTAAITLVTAFPDAIESQRAILQALPPALAHAHEAWLQTLALSHPNDAVARHAYAVRFAHADADRLLAVLESSEHERVRRLGLRDDLATHLVDRVTREPDAGDRLLRAWLARGHDLRHLAPEAASRLARALATLDSAVATVSLVALAGHPNARVARDAACGALARASDPADVAHVLRLDADVGALVRVAPEAAIEVGPPAGPLLASLYARVPADDLALRQRYFAAFEALADPRLGPLVAESLEAHDDETVRAALHTLAVIGGHDVLRLVKPLTSGVFRGRDTKELARKVQDAILARRGDPTGALSVSPDRAHAGGLSVDPARDAD